MLRGLLYVFFLPVIIPLKIIGGFIDIIGTFLIANDISNMLDNDDEDDDGWW